MELDVVTDPDEIKKVIPVIKSAWGMQNMDQLVKDILCSFRFHGGLVLIARDNEEILGMQYSYPGFKKGKVYLYSHMTGVVENRKYSGIGRAMKMEQKKWAMDHGFDLIAWTYDPLMSLNANFNTHILGTVSRTYLRNFYGEMEDPLNSGVPTDRFVTEWHITQQKNPPSEKTQEILWEDAASINYEDLPALVTVPVPENYIALKKENKERAMHVRSITRDMFERLFGIGYVVIDFQNEKHSYVLSRDTTMKENIGENIFL